MKDKGYEFVQQDKPRSPSDVKSQEALDPNADYTKESELKALFSNHQCPTDHKVQMEALLSLNCQDFYKNYLADDAEYEFSKFIQSRGELNIVMGSWNDPTQDELTALPSVQKIKKLKADF